MTRIAAISLAAAILLIAPLFAQQSERGPDGTSNTTVPGISILPISGQPFSGVDNIEWTRTTSNGSSITKHLKATLARDSQGRIYREHHRFVSGDIDEHSPITYISISDPVARTKMTCYARTFVCNLSDYAAPPVPALAAIGSLDSGARFRTRENLGADRVEGMDVNHIREITTTRPGANGNDRELVETREFWFNEKLQTNLKILRDDPVAGKQVVYVSDLSLGDPNPALFQTPIGFSVRDIRSAGRHAAMLK